MVGPSTYPFTMSGGTWAGRTLDTMSAVIMSGTPGQLERLA